MPKKKQTKKIEIDSYSHKGKKRKNNPPVGLVTSATDKMDGKTKYAHDPHIDPYLSWAGKKEGEEFEVQNVSLHIHERIDPKRIVQSFLKKEKEKGKIEHQMSLFSEPENEPPLNKAIDFYKHEQDWTNRLIAGDSLLVMNSLLNKEGMEGKVQMIYIDPPYGIKYNSNFQPFTNKTQVKDRDDDIPAEPEMIQAFRDTWELEIHSYLSHLYNRMILAKDLLSDTGSCFVQINDENIHHVKELMDEVFGPTNFINVITFRTTSGLGGNFLSTNGDYLIWYAKDKKQAKYNQLFVQKEFGYGTMYKFIEEKDGTRRPMNEAELRGAIKNGDKPYRLSDLVSSGRTETCVFDYEYEGTVYPPGRNRSWKTNLNGMNILKEQRRIDAPGKTLQYVNYYHDFPVSSMTNFWNDTVGELKKSYVVQTSEGILQRCILMTTDPGDLVFDPTCGSGTTAFMAEQWGRRWITCDTSRVAVTLAKQRLMTAKYDYYNLSHPTEGIRSGFNYKMVPHTTLGSITNNQPLLEETLYDQPKKESSKVRVAGPFTVEAVPSLRIKPLEGDIPKVEVTGTQLARIGETGNEAIWRDELKATGIRGVGKKMIMFSRIEPMKGTRFLHAEAETIEDGGNNKKAVISFGSEYGPMEQRHVEEAVKEARGLKESPDFVIFAAFHFDPEAAKDIDEINEHVDFTILKAQMSVDLLTQDLRKKKRENQSYWLIGQPDVEVEKLKDGTYKVKVNGFDYYDPVSGEIESKSNKHIAMWFLDSDYDERSLLPDQVFFPQGDAKRDWTKLAKALNGEVDDELIEAFTGTESIPFKAGAENKVAVKIIDNRGIESFVIKKLQ